MIPRTLLFILFATSLPAAEPEKLTKLRGSYESAITKATAPIQKTYTTELEKLKIDFTKVGNLEAAIAVDAELKKLASLQSPQSPAEQSPLPGAGKRLSTSDKKKIIDLFEEKTWEFSPFGTKGIICYFKKGGSGLYQGLDGVIYDTVSWSLEDDGTLLINGFGRHKKVVFISDKEATVEHHLPDGTSERGLSAHLSERTITKP